MIESLQFLWIIFSKLNRHNKLGACMLQTFLNFIFILFKKFIYFLLPSKREFSKSDLSTAPLIPLDPQESFNCLALFNCLLKIKELSSNKVRTSSIQPGNWKIIWTVFVWKTPKSTWTWTLTQKVWVGSGLA